MKKIFKFIILFLLAFVMLEPKSVSADGDFQMEGSKLVKYTGTSSSVAIPDSVTTVGVNAFTKNTNLKVVYFPDTVTTIEAGAFEYCLNLEAVKLPSSLRTIEFLAFRGCEKLSSVDLPQNLISIGADAFMQCQSLTEVTIPASTAFLEYGVFAGCANLKAIHVENGNKQYCESDGILYTADMQTLVQYPNGKNEVDVVIKDGVRRIERASIYENYTIETIKLPETLNTIGIYAFKDCHLLETIELPNNVGKVEEHAFANCYNLKKVIVNNSATSFDAAVFENDMDVVLYAPAGSAAESYSASKGLNFEILKEDEAVEEDASEKAETEEAVPTNSSVETPNVTAEPAETDLTGAEETTHPLFYVFVVTAVLSLAGIIVIRRKLKEYED